MLHPRVATSPITRRQLLANGTLLLAARHNLLSAPPTDPPLLKIGLLSDVHYANKPARGSRHYRDSLQKLTDCITSLNETRADLIVELGDLIDKASSPDEEIAWLQEINACLSKSTAPRHYVLGNHCLSTLSKPEFSRHTNCNPNTHYSFNAGPIRIVILDACFTSDGTPYANDNFDWKDANIPPQQAAWLRQDLATADRPVIVFVHQRLDPHGPHSIRNAPEIRAILEASRHVSAVFQGHSHANDYSYINGIHYCTLVAMVEGQGQDNSGFASLEILQDQSLRVRGFRRQSSLALDPRS